MEWWQTLLLSIVGAAGTIGLDRLVIYLLERRARARQANAEADKTGADARKTDAEADNLQAEAWKKAFDNLERSLTGQIKFQETRIAELTGQAQKQEARIGELVCDMSILKRSLQRAYDRISYLMNGIRRLIAQLDRQNIKPCWTPDEWKPDQDTVNG